MKRFTARAWRTAAVVAVGLMAFGLTSVGEVAATPSPKIGICHATNSHSNPYNAIDVDTSSVDELNNLDANGHGDHVGPVWEEGITVKWGDIIPPFEGPDDLHFPGLNWTEKGQAIWRNGCEIPDYVPDFGAIEVTKVVDAPKHFENTKFEICVTGPAPATTTTCQTITGSGVLTFDHLEVGDYVVSEPNLDAKWTPDVVPSTVSVTAGDIETVTITNTREEGGGGGGGRGQIWVTKVVEGEGAPSDITFQICVEPVVAEATTLAMSEEPHSHEHETCKTVSAGEVAKFEGLPLGEYMITETDPGEDWDVTGSGTTVTVTRGQKVRHTITNTWAPAPETGSVQVDKVVIRAGGDTTEFQICIRPAGDLEAEPMCTFLADAEEPYTFDGLLPGTYEVYEPALPAGWIVSVNPLAAVVVAGQTTEVTVTNTWIEQQPVIVPTTGSVALTKLVEGTPAEGEDIDGTFDLCLIGPAPATTEICRTIDTEDGTGTVLISGLFPGTYTVTEADPGADYAVTISDETVTVVAGGLDAATITNTILTDGEEPIIPPVNPPDDDEDSDSGGPVPTPPTGALPHTGIELTLALIATATLGAGALLLTVARRRPIR